MFEMVSENWINNCGLPILCSSKIIHGKESLMLSIIDQVLLTVLASVAVGGVILFQVLKAENPANFPRMQAE